MHKHIFLVVDDFEPMRKIIAVQLRALGAEQILEAKNGVEALRILLSQPVHLVISDWNMPVMTGLELLAAMRANARFLHTPFIMVTANTERAQITEALSSGVRSLLVKPFTRVSLGNAIIKVLALPHSILPAALPVKPLSENPLQTILLVDDTQDNLLMLSQLLKDEYRVRVCSSGAKALKICQSDDPPDLVLLDIMMPDMDGFEVAQHMREHPISETIPIMFVTAMNNDEARLKGFELGAVDFITKPVNADILKPRVRNFMQYIKLNKQLQADFDGMLEWNRLHENALLISRHDMQESLSVMLGLLQALGKDSTLSSRQLTQLRLVEEAALQVINMVNLTSELFKIEAGQYNLDAKAVNLCDILSRNADIFRIAFMAKQLTIAIDTDEALDAEKSLALGDSMLCHSLFHNLIKNACEAAPAMSRISVILFDESPLRVTIRNQGVIPLQVREQFFDKFVTYGKPGASGLGSYSASLLSQVQNGSIALYVDDQQNQTTITVTLPRYPSQPG